MFKPNTKHLQPAIITAASELPEKQQKRLKNSWADTFYQEFFYRIDEEPFAVLYSEKASRPNVPVNVLVGLEALKAGFGWSDQELYERFCYDLQVRYALGYDRLGDGDFEIRTLYYFRERLSQYNAEHGTNLLEKAFEQVTDAQITALKVRTGMQRMDSTQIASNIVSASRLQLLVEGLQRVERILSETDQGRLADLFAPYTRDSSGHYTYRVKGQKAVLEHLERLGKTIYELLQELRDDYADESAYQVLARLFSDNFNLIENNVKAKENTELTSDCLQSVDDLEASYRTKSQKHYKGYVANITETCDPDNEVQLITKVQVAPNNVDDTQLLKEALPDLKERTELEIMFTDGGYGSSETDEILAENQVEQIQTAIRGRKPSHEKLHLSDFEIKQTDDGKPTQITCPDGQTVSVQSSNKRKSFVAHFGEKDCQTCPLLPACPVKQGKRDQNWHLRFTQDQANVAQRRRRSLTHQKEGRNLRAAVESTVRQVKHPFSASKLPVRGQFRVSCMIIGSAMMSNIRRIQRCLEAKTRIENEQITEENNQNKQRDAKRELFDSFLSSLISCFHGLISPLSHRNFIFGF
jgi:hypothetical protein